MIWHGWPHNVHGGFLNCKQPHWGWKWGWRPLHSVRIKESDKISCHLVSKPFGPLNYIFATAEIWNQRYYCCGAKNRQKFSFETANFGRYFLIFTANYRRWHWFSSNEIIQIPWILKGFPIQSYTIENFDKSRSPFFGNFAAILRQIWYLSKLCFGFQLSANVTQIKFKHKVNRVRGF